MAEIIDFKKASEALLVRELAPLSAVPAAPTPGTVNVEVLELIRLLIHTLDFKKDRKTAKATFELLFQHLYNDGMLPQMMPVSVEVFEKLRTIDRQRFSNWVSTS